MRSCRNAPLRAERGHVQVIIYLWFCAVWPIEVREITEPGRCWSEIGGGDNGGRVLGCLYEQREMLGNDASSYVWS